MSTFNRTYRAPKFFLCVNTTDNYHIGLEKAEHRYSHFCFLCWGSGNLHVLEQGQFKKYISDGVKKLVDISHCINSNVVAETFENSKGISFCSWNKDDKWNGKILETSKIKSEKEYSCIISFEGSCFVNGREIGEMEYADLKKSKEYDIVVPEGSSTAFFELC
tara:strand:+ start:105 stop:593 length:489 start_codon:yes stop_codon:yes gene_type:complete